MPPSDFPLHEQPSCWLLGKETVSLPTHTHTPQVYKWTSASCRKTREQIDQGLKPFDGQASHPGEVVGANVATP